MHFRAVTDYTIYFSGTSAVYGIPARRG